MNEIVQHIGKIGVVPVITIERAEDAAPLGKALSAGGLPCAEITLRTPASIESLGALTAAMPDMLVGAGTVLSIEQAERALAAGAKFMVSPGFDPALVDWCLAHDVAITPGVATPTEVIMARNKGLRVVKFFPSELYGGTKALKALGEPFGDMKFLPTGGITLAALPDYLQLKSVHAVGGSWMANKQMISAGQFDEITRLAAEAVGVVRQVRG